MPLRPSIDDNNTTLIKYEGEWEYLVGSSRQWETAVHMTRQEGATATFKFRGYQLWIWGTIPAGVGTNTIDISIDGNTPIVSSRTSNGSAVFNEPYYESPLLRDTYHTVVVTNRGKESTGSAEFLLDRFEFETTDNIPLFTPTGASTTPTPSATPSATTTDIPVSASSSGGSKTPWGGIIGAIVGVFALLIAFLLYLLWRRRKRDTRRSEAEKSVSAPTDRPNLAPVPFPLDRTAPTNSQSSMAPLSPSRFSENTAPNTSASLNNISEKAGYQRSLQLASGSTNHVSIPAALTSSTTLETAASSQPRAAPLSPGGATDTFNEGASSMYAPHTSQQAMPSSPPTTSEAATLESDAYDIPPPSYWPPNTTART